MPAGAYVVSHAQPSGRLIRNLLDPKTDQPQDFIKRQEERRARRQPDQIYDITAWSLPLLVRRRADHERFDDRREGVNRSDDLRRRRRVRGAFAQGKVGYLIPWGTAAASLTVDALQQNLRVRSVGGAFTLNGRRYPDRHRDRSRRRERHRPARAS